MTSALLEKATFAWETIPEALPEGAVSGPSPLHNASESTPPHHLGRTRGHQGSDSGASWLL